MRSAPDTTPTCAPDSFERPSASAADGHQPLARSLASNPAAPFDKVKVAQSDPDQLTEANPGVKE
jgi:hypothetical protein